MKRIVSFDYLRSISIVGILMCHFCCNFSETFWFGSWCGGTFNALFIMMSALLLGMQWEKHNRPKLGLSFLIHRIAKLSKTYYLFLVFMFMFCYFLADIKIGIKDVLMHIAYLPWFDKIQGFGHLWFLTMIMFCYIASTIISRITMVKNAIGGGKTMIFSVLSVLSIALMFVVDKYGLPGYMFLYLALFIICFLESKNIVSYFTKQKLYVAIMLIPVIILVLCYFYGSESEDIKKIMGILSAFSILGMGLITLRDANSNKYVSYVATISFEIYMVHHIFSYGRFSIMQFTSNWFLGWFIFLFASVILGSVLYYISKLIFHNEK